jgi:hypothetical protein
MKPKSIQQKIAEEKARQENAKAQVEAYKEALDKKISESKELNYDTLSTLANRNPSRFWTMASTTRHFVRPHSHGVLADSFWILYSHRH